MAEAHHLVHMVTLVVGTAMRQRTRRPADGARIGAQKPGYPAHGEPPFAVQTGRITRINASDATAGACVRSTYRRAASPIASSAPASYSISRQASASATPSSEPRASPGALPS